MRAASGTGTRSRNTSAGNTRSTSGNSSRGARQSAREHDGSGREILGVILILIGILLGVFCFFGSSGLLGAVAPVLFGMFGVATYFVPFILIALGVLLIAVPRNELRPGTIVLIAVIVLALLALVHIISQGKALVGAKFGETLHTAIEEGSLRRGGGFVGGLFAYLFVLLLGTTGGIIALLGVILIAALLVTHFSISAHVQKLREAHRSTEKHTEKRQEKERSHRENIPTRTERRNTAEADDSGFIEHSGRPLTAGDSIPGYKRGAAQRTGRKRTDGADTGADTETGRGYGRIFRRNTRDDEIEFMPTSGPIETVRPAKRHNRDKELQPGFNVTGSSEYDIHGAPNGPRRRGRDSELDIMGGEALAAGVPGAAAAVTGPAADIEDILQDVVITRYDDGAPSAVTEPVPEDPGTTGDNDENAGENTENSNENTEGGENGEPVKAEIEQTEPVYEYRFPPIDLLDKPDPSTAAASESPAEKAKILLDTLQSFNIPATMVNINVGPVITRFELLPAQGIRISRITSLSNNIAMSLAASGVRIEAPIPGKSAIGVEIPNRSAAPVLLREILETDEFKNARSPLTFSVGKDIAGKVVLGDLSKMPHMLVAGTTGSGKSVCINSIILSLIYKSSPKDVRMILIDPKVVELSIFSSLPHLFCPVVTDPKKASGALLWAANEMDTRYRKMSEFSANVRDISRYNALQTDENEKWPRLVIIIDELADLMLVAAKDVEDSICRIAQKGRACGIHLIVATQRPSVDVITGLIKANIPSRIAFAVNSGIDSRVILDMLGAEKLIGRGDMLFHPNGANKPIRAQGSFVSDEEVEAVTNFFTAEAQNSAARPVFHEDMLAEISSGEGSSGQGNGKQEDELLPDAVRLVIESGQASISMLQRRLRVGYSRAARLIDMMEQAKYVSEPDGSKPRKVLITAGEYNRIFGGAPISDGAQGGEAQ
ncbi:MAG: DNA translocase FtsK [Clostridia bacterium]|nr:DNA translocase FtsK [Clostridia bacterium]